jgi:ABC-type uncharacterized transport system involved in gliding motility auxiliary subunit
MTFSRNVLAWSAIVIAALLFVAVNVLSQNLLRSARLDLTEGKLYTLSDATRSILNNLDEPLTVRFFFSQSLAADLPTINQYARRVQELLETYASESGGAITLQVIEPEPFSEAEDEAVSYGLQGVPVNAAGDRLYFGMAATNTTDDREVIPFFQDQREAFLEYDLTRAFYRLANPKRPVVGLISTLPVAGGFDSQRGVSQPWVVAKQIQQLFELKDLGTDITEVPEDVDVLMVVHPKDLSESTRYAIDQFVLAGGHTMVFVDPFSEVAAGGLNPQDPVRLHNSSLPELFKAWGVKLEPGMVVADRLAARRVRTGPPDRPEAVDYVAWLSLDRQAMNQDEVVTSQLGVINLATAGALTPLEDSSVTFVPLLKSSPQSMLIERLQVQFVPDPKKLLADFKATGKEYVMAARVTGPVTSAFPDGPPGSGGDAGEGESGDGGEGGKSAPPEGHLTESATPANLILVADSDILDDRTWVNVQNFAGQSFAVPIADNGAMVVNALDVLSGSSELISLRSRGTSARPFEVVQNLERKAEDQFRETEQMLEARIHDTEQKLADLQTGAGEGGSAALVLTPEQSQAITEFRQQLVSTRKQLRDVQLALRRDIESLGTLLKFLNIALVPLIIGILAVVISVIRRRRRKRVMGLA